MDFFEALERNATTEAFRQGERWEGMGDVELGINATIETLKEMMMGEPIEGIIVHETIGSMEFTSIFETDCGNYHEEEEIAVFEGHHRTDGEEVRILIVYLS